MATREAKAERIEIRTTAEVKALLQQAAIASHKNVTDFLVDAGVTAAEEALMDRRTFRLDEERWKAFNEILDRPVVHKPRLAALLAKKSIIE
ncbi:type II toxin-antitoxin system TacA family antitoxin [Salinarimonas chemoclinalis]|uniref:type II toxin-antitoxin system TacA family antitoxin n=1 Tax=Salinarimonas chemoclinalis TaxID=3241599 RepID=UPI00355788AF